MKYHIGDKIYYIKNECIEEAYIADLWIEIIPITQHYCAHIRIDHKDGMSESFLADELGQKTFWHDKYYLTMDEVEIELFPF